MDRVCRESLLQIGVRWPGQLLESLLSIAERRENIAIEISSTLRGIQSYVEYMRVLNAMNSESHKIENDILYNLHKREKIINKKNLLN